MVCPVGLCPVLPTSSTPRCRTQSLSPCFSGPASGTSRTWRRCWRCSLPTLPLSSPSCLHTTIATWGIGNKQCAIGGKWVLAWPGARRPQPYLLSHRGLCAADLQAGARIRIDHSALQRSYVLHAFNAPTIDKGKAQPGIEQRLYIPPGKVGIEGVTPVDHRGHPGGEQVQAAQADDRVGFLGRLLSPPTGNT